MNYSFYIARRLSFSKGERKSLPAVKVAISSVAISVAVMLASVWIVLGFKHEIMEKVTGFNSDLSVYVADTQESESNTILLTSSLFETIEEIPTVREIAPSLSMPAVFKTPDDFKGVYIKNLSTKRTSDFIKHSLIEGKLPDYSSSGNDNKIVISQNAARALGLKAGDKIDTYFITDAVRVRRLEIAGVYSSHFDAYDDVYMFGSLQLLRGVQGLKDNRATGLHITIDNFDNVGNSAVALQNHLLKAYNDGTVHQLYRVDSVLSSGAGYLNWLGLLNTNVIVIIILMLAVGSVTLVSGMLIIVLDKKRFIGVMKAIGCPSRKLRRVFIYLSMRVTFTGIVIGDIIATGLLWCQSKWHFIHLDADAYYIDFVPVSMDWLWLIAINAGVIVVSYLVLLIPSRLISRISPSETMRDE